MERIYEVKQGIHSLPRTGLSSIKPRLPCAYWLPRPPHSQYPPLPAPLPLPMHAAIATLHRPRPSPPATPPPTALPAPPPFPNPSLNHDLLRPHLIAHYHIHNLLIHSAQREASPPQPKKNHFIHQKIISLRIAPHSIGSCRILTIRLASPALALLAGDGEGTMKEVRGVVGCGTRAQIREQHQ